MGRRDINHSYDEVHLRTTRYIVAHQICVVSDVRVQLDGITHYEIIWTPYEDHKLSRPFETIYLFLGHLRLSSLSQRHMLEHVLHHLATSRAFHDHWCWLRVLVHMSLTRGGCSLQITWWQVLLLFLPSVCVPEYMSWFMTVSHPYICKGELGDRRKVVHVVAFVV